MLSRLRSHVRRPSPALVVAVIALIVALGGSAFAAGVVITKSSQLGKNVVTTKQIKKNSVTGVKVKDHSLTGADLRLGTLGKVGSAANADNAGHANNADNAGHANNADNAAHAGTADIANAILPHEAFHEVGAAGEPAFQNGWANRELTNGKQTVAFYKDREGVVHLKGAADGPAPFTVIFQLPAGYRPFNGREWIVAAPCACQEQDGNGDSVPLPVGQVTITGDGRVILSTNNYGVASTSVYLDGITFPAT